MISREQAAEIRRLYYAEKWKVGTICKQLDVHAETVERVISPSYLSCKQKPPRVKLLDPYQGFILETLEKYPKLAATRVYDMIKERGYTGSLSLLTQHIRQVRPAPKSEVFVRIERLPAEQAQIDWGYINKMSVLGGERRLWVFAMTLPYSRAIYAELVFDLTVHSLLSTLRNSCLFFQGTARQWLFDNPKTVVISRAGDLVKYHADLLNFATQMNVELRLCGVRKPHHKGSVERAIRYLKDRFFSARTIENLDEGNIQLHAFLKTIAMERTHSDGMTVKEKLQVEQNHLLDLPSSMPEVDLVTSTRSQKTCLVTFDRNRYSHLPINPKTTLTLIANDREVRIVHQDKVLAQHQRCWGTKQIIEAPEHREAILASKPESWESQGRRLLVTQIPSFEKLLQHWLDEGTNLRLMVKRSLKLLDLYSTETLKRAINTKIHDGIYDLGAITMFCEYIERSNKTIKPPELGAHVIERDVKPHDLEIYDA